MQVRAGLQRWAGWFEKPSHRWTVGPAVAGTGMGLIALGYVARDQKMVGGETVMTATTASWAFWIVGALLFVAGVFVLALPPYLLRGQRPPPQPSSGPLVQPSGSLDLRVTRGPGSPDVDLVDWQTHGRPLWEVATNGAPVALRFHEYGLTIRVTDLPANVGPPDKPIVTVKKFTANGFSVEEHTTGDRVRAEVYAQAGAATARGSADDAAVVIDGPARNVNPNQLSSYVQRAQQLETQSVTTLEEREAWNKDYDAWRREASEWLHAASPDLSRGFLEAGKIEDELPVVSWDAFDGHHQRLLALLSRSVAYLERLQGQQKQMYDHYQDDLLDSIDLAKLIALRAEVPLLLAQCPQEPSERAASGFRPAYALWQTNVRQALAGHAKLTAQFFSDQPSKGNPAEKLVPAERRELEHRKLMLDAIIEHIKYVRGL